MGPPRSRLKFHRRQNRRDFTFLLNYILMFMFFFYYSPDFFKCFKDNPWYWALCTLSWHLIQSGTCFLFILASILSKLLSFTLIVLICFRWCISILSSLPQLTQICPILDTVLIFHNPAYRGSLKLYDPTLKSMGFLSSLGNWKFIFLVSPLLLV